MESANITIPKKITVGVRMPREWNAFLIKLTGLYNLKTGKLIRLSDIIRMCVQRGAPLLVKEVGEKFGETIEIPKEKSEQ